MADAPGRIIANPVFKSGAPDAAAGRVVAVPSPISGPPDTHAGRIVIIEGPSSGDPSGDFIVVAFDPLRGSFINATSTTLTLNIQQVVGSLNTAQIEIKINKVLIYGLNADPGQVGVVAWATDYAAGSTISDLGSGVFQFAVVKSTPWITGIRNEVLLFLPFE